MASWESLPPDIVTEILVRLPVGLLIRLRLVCKQWSAIIQSQSFVKFHLHYSMQNIDGSSLFLLDNFGRNRNAYAYSGRYPIRKFAQVVPVYYHVAGTCNGLVLVIQNRLSSSSPLFYVWNPVTGKCGNLPQPKFVEESYLKNMRKDYRHGFGYDDQVNDFKVVQFRRKISSSDENLVGHYPVDKALVYSFRARAWKLLEDSCLPVGFYKRRHVHIHGVLFWIGFRESDADFILSFDLSKEVFTTMPMPMPVLINPPRSRPHSSTLGVYEDESLALFTVGTSSTDHIDVWAMKKDRESWMKMYTVFLEPEFSSNGVRHRDTIRGLWKQCLIIKTTSSFRGKSVSLLNINGNGNGNGKDKGRKRLSDYSTEYYEGIYVESLFPVR